MRRPISILSLLVLLGCGDEPTAITAGTQMSVGDQVAIESALLKVADSLKIVGRTQGDSVLADLARVGARLVRLNGREGAVTVTAPGSAVPIAMKGVGFHAVERGSAGSTSRHNHVVVAWEALDNIALTVRRALVVVVDTTLATGTFTLPGTVTGSQGARFLDFTPTTGGIYAGGAGTLTVESARYRGGCVGLPNSAIATCAVGVQNVRGSVTVTKLGGTTPSTVSWELASLPSFEIVTGNAP